MSTSVLGIAFGFSAMFLMYKLWGYPFDHEKHKSGAPRWAMALHRGLGYAFALLYIALMCAAAMALPSRVPGAHDVPYRPRLHGRFPAAREDLDHPMVPAFRGMDAVPRHGDHALYGRIDRLVAAVRVAGARARATRVLEGESCASRDVAADRGTARRDTRTALDRVRVAAGSRGVTR